MNIISFPDYLKNIKVITQNTICNNEINIIKTKVGNAILISECEFNALLNSMHKSPYIFNKIE